MRLYYVLFAGSIIVTAILSIKGAAITLLFLTLGLGLPLLFAPTALIYLVCLLPAFAAFSSTRARLPGVLISLVFVAATAIIPHLVASADAQKISDMVAANDYDRTLRLGARSLEIVRAASLDNGNGPFPLSQEACGPECRHLLLTRQMAWIRVTTIATSLKGGKTVEKRESTTFLSGHGDQCRLNGQTANIEQQTCILNGANNNDQAEVLITVNSEIVRPTQTSPWVRQKAIRTLSLATLAGDTYRPLMQQTESVIEAASVPLLILPSMAGLTSSGAFEIGRSSGRYHDISLQDSLTKIGYDFAGMEETRQKPRDFKDRQPPDDSLSVEVLSILNLPVDQRFTEAQTATLNQWIDAARSYGGPASRSPMSETGKDILRRLIRDPRVETGFFMGQVLEDQPTLLAELVPQILDTLEKGHGPRSGAAYSAAQALMTLETEQLGPYANRILGIHRQYYPGYDPMITAFGKLGRDPLPLLRPFEDESYSYKLRALCLADPEWSSAIRAEMLDYVAGLPANDRGLRDKLRSVEKVMARHGGLDDLEKLYRDRFPDQLKRWSIGLANLTRFKDRC